MSKILNDINDKIIKTITNTVKDTVGEEKDEYSVTVNGYEDINNRFTRFLDEMLFFNAKEYTEEQLKDIKEEFKELLKHDVEDDEIDLDDVNFVKKQYVTNLMQCFQFEVLRELKNERLELLIPILYNLTDNDNKNDLKSEDFCQG